MDIKRSMVPLDKELQWLNVKQKLFRQIIQTYLEPV